jgi:hypothetical protein
LAANVRHDSRVHLIAPLPSLIHCSHALVVESNDALGLAAHGRHDEAGARIKFFGMPLDLGNHPARLAPASGLIAEARMTPAHMVRRSSDRTLEQIADPLHSRARLCILRTPRKSSITVMGTVGEAPIVQRILDGTVVVDRDATAVC